jgi:hypothetical protein
VLVRPRQGISPRSEGELGQGGGQRPIWKRRFVAPTGSGELASALAARSLSNYFGATICRTHEQPEFDRFGILSDARRMSAAILALVHFAAAVVVWRGLVG